MLLIDRVMVPGPAVRNAVPARDADIITRRPPANPINRA
jgi:hypothetical protein